MASSYAALSEPPTQFDFDPADLPTSSGTWVLPNAAAEAVRTGMIGWALPTIAGFEIEREIGRGGMGVVYQARHTLLHRPCAIKMILAAHDASPEQKGRFLLEAESTANLSHPHIARLYSIGECEGRLFLEMEYADGGSLERKLDGSPWPALKAAAVIEPIARAVAEAHAHDILHRDIKPANILLMADGTPKLGDFGLAKQLHRESVLTGNRAILGSPSYMAPEQADARTEEIGPRSDLYSLGAILYELLTGRPPFRGVNVQDTLEQVKSLDPVRPSELVPRVPLDLETITLKCLEKEPGKRYETARELAADLRRFLDGKPIQARRLGPLEACWRWATRNQRVASLGVLTIAGVAVAMMSLTSLWLRAERRFSQTLEQSLAGSEPFESVPTTSKSGQGGGPPLADLAWTAVESGRTDVARSLLLSVPPPLRDWEWRFAYRQTHPRKYERESAGSRVEGLFYSPDGQELIVASAESGQTRVEVLESETGRLIRFLPPIDGDPRCLAPAPDGQTLAIASQRQGRAFTQILAVESGKVLATYHEPSFSNVDFLEFSPDASRVVMLLRSDDARTASQVVVRSWRDGRGYTLLETPGEVSAMAFLGGGDRLLIGWSWPGRVEIWDLDGSKRLSAWEEDPRRVTALASDAEGRWWASASGDAAIRLHDGSEAKAALALIAPEGWIRALAFSADGRRLVTSTTNLQIGRVWSVPEGRLIGCFPGQAPTPASLAIRPDSHEIATADGGRRIAVWDTRTSHPVVFSEHGSPVIEAAFRRDGLRVLSKSLDPASRRQTTLVWNPDTGELDSKLSESPPEREFAPAKPRETSVDSPDGRRRARFAPGLAASTSHALGQGGRVLEILETTSEEPVCRLGVSVDSLRCVEFSHDGARVATGGLDGSVILWDPSSGRQMLTLQAHGDLVSGLTFSPDGERLLSWSRDGTVRVWDTRPIKEPAATQP